MRAALQAVRVADDVEDVRRPTLLAVDDHAAVALRERALGDQPDLAVDLDRLGAAGAQAPGRMSTQGLRARPASVFLGTSTVIPGPVDRDLARRMRRVLGLCCGPGRGAASRAVGGPRAGRRGCLQARDLGLGPLGGAGQAGEDVDQVLLAVAGQSASSTWVAADLGDGGEGRAVPSSTATTAWPARGP